MLALAEFNVRPVGVDEEQHFVSHILAFFAASDGIVVENLGARFMSGEHHCRLCHRPGAVTGAVITAPTLLPTHPWLAGVTRHH